MRNKLSIYYIYILYIPLLLQGMLNIISDKNVLIKPESASMNICHVQYLTDVSIQCFYY